MKMPCPYCHEHKTGVEDTFLRQDAEGIWYILRRRKCFACKKTFKSIENRECDLAEESNG